MVPLINIERGTVVAGRYVVSEVLRPWLAGFPEAGTVCLVIDAILDEPAQLYVADSSRSGDLLDAARRAALLTDPRIPGLHDVGRADGLDFVVSERPTATPLPALLASGPLDPEAARALIGEAATALVHASKRGLHHLCLGPDSIGLGSWPRPTAVTYFPHTAAGDAMFDYFKKVVTFQPLDRIGNVIDVSQARDNLWK